MEVPDTITLEWLKKGLNSHELESEPDKLLYKLGSIETNADWFLDHKSVEEIPAEIFQEFLLLRIPNESGPTILHRMISGHGLLPDVPKCFLNERTLMEKDSSGWSVLEYALMSGLLNEIPFGQLKPASWNKHLEHLHYLQKRESGVKPQYDRREALEEFVKRVEAVERIRRKPGIAGVP